MQRQRYTIIGTKNGYNVKDFIMAYSETEARLIYERSRPEVEVTECYITKANDWHGEASMEIHSQHLRRKIEFSNGTFYPANSICSDHRYGSEYEKFLDKMDDIIEQINKLEKEST